MILFDKKEFGGYENRRKPEKGFEGIELESGNGFHKFKAFKGKVCDKFKGVEIGAFVKVRHNYLLKVLPSPASAVKMFFACFIIARQGRFYNSLQGESNEA